MADQLKTREKADFFQRSIMACVRIRAGLRAKTVIVSVKNGQHYNANRVMAIVKAIDNSLMTTCVTSYPGMVVCVQV